METPPTLPTPKPPLGSRFVILLVLPIVLMALALSATQWAEQSMVALLAVAGIATLVCSILLARQFGRHFAKPDSSSTGLAFLLFFALQAFYGICFFVGCTAMVMAA